MFFNPTKPRVKGQNLNKGMTYVELIVVLSIFAILSGAVMFNYKAFQSRVDIKNLANDIALKLTEAQKNSIAGKWNSYAGINWKPAYGLHLRSANNNRFLYFVDLNNDDSCGSSGCTNFSIDITSGGEVSDVISITKGNTISNIGTSGSGCPATLSDVTITFKRPNASPVIKSSTSLVGCSLEYVSINLNSLNSISASVRIYSSGRVQIN